MRAMLTLSFCCFLRKQSLSPEPGETECLFTGGEVHVPFLPVLALKVSYNLCLATSGWLVDWYVLMPQFCQYRWIILGTAAHYRFDVDSSACRIFSLPTPWIG